MQVDIFHTHTNNFFQRDITYIYKALFRQSLDSLLLLQSVEVVFGLEFDLDVSGGQLLVDADDGFNLFSDGGFFVLVEEDLLDDGAIELVSVSSADDGSGLAQIFKNGIINGGQSSVSGSLLRSVVLDPLGLDSSLGNDEDSGLESLFEFRDELGVNSVEESEGSIRNVDDEDVLLLSLGGGFDFSDTSNIEVLQEVLNVSNGVFNFEESLSNRFFNGRRLGSDGFEELRLVV